MKDQTIANPLLCDMETGLCALPENPGLTATNQATPAGATAVTAIYFTDPICSSCWGIEPQLRQLKLAYGNSLEIEYRMGGLLPNWSYNSGGISQPSDVARHWDEASAHYDMPIDGDVWLEDPMHSSFPPSIAFKAAQMQDKEKAVSFLRILREMLFLEKKNISKWEHLAAAAGQAGLDPDRFKTDFEGPANALFEEDLQLAAKMSVRGFPTIFFQGPSGNTEVVYGSRPYAFYETAILKLNPAAAKNEYSKNWESLFAKFPTMTAREFAELSGTPRKESGQLLNELSDKGMLEKYTTKNGGIWKLKKSLS